MKKCAYCGADLEDSAGYCTRCGRPAESFGNYAGSYENGNTSQPYGSPYQANQGYYGGPVPARYNGMAIASLVLGIVSIFFNTLYLVPSILAIIFGVMARSQISKNPNQQGAGMAVAGLVLGIVFLAIYLIVILIALVAGSYAWNFYLSAL